MPSCSESPSSLGPTSSPTPSTRPSRRSSPRRPPILLCVPHKAAQETSTSPAATLGHRAGGARRHRSGRRRRPSGRVRRHPVDVRRRRRRHGGRRQRPARIGTNWTDAPAQDGSVPLRLAQGREPRGAEDVVLDVKTADQAGYQVGDSVALITPGDPPQVTATMVGTAEFGGGASLAGATLALFDTETAQDSSSAGRTPTPAWRSLRVMTPTSLSFATGSRRYFPRRRGEDRRRGHCRNSGEPRGGPRFLQHLPAGVRRCRAARRHLPDLEHVLDPGRAADSGNGPVPSFGATRRQVTRSVMLEALAVGIVGSTLGLLLGLGVAQPSWPSGCSGSISAARAWSCCPAPCSSRTPSA